MEIFVDGGLFEMIIAACLGLFINMIFQKKYLLLVYSCIVIVAPLLLILIPRSDVFYILVSITILNSILLTVLLWRQRIQSPGQPLFDLSTWKERFSLRKNKSSFKN